MLTGAPMVKVCPTCGSFWFGGQHCHTCGPGHELLDCASAEAEPWVHEHRVNIRTFYWARSAMLLSALGLLAGIVAGLLLYEYGVRTAGGWPYKLGALAAALAPPYAIYRGVTWVFRRQVSRDLRASGKTSATAPDMVGEETDTARYK